MAQLRAQRESLTAILRELHLQSLSRGQQDALMAAVGFEEDVAFAKSLFTERVAHIYREIDGQFEKFIARDAVSKMPTEGRQFLVAVFRRYHEEKQKGREGRQVIGGLRLPDPGSIGEVISFQKKMYQLFRHLIPPQPPLLPLFYPSSPTPKFSPFAIYPPERSHNRLDQDFPPLPFLPFSHRPSVDSLRRSDSQMDRQSFFSRNSFMDMERMSSHRAEQPQEERGVLKGFTTFGEEEEGFHPTKRLKLDENANFAPENVQNIRKELDLLAQTRKGPSRAIPTIDRSTSLHQQKDPPKIPPIRRGTAQYQHPTKPSRDVPSCPKESE